MNEDALSALLEKEAITAVIHRRARTTDERDLEGSLSCYHPGATEDHEGFDGPVDEYLRTASPAFQLNSPVEVCSHLIGNIEIELAGDRAKSRCYFVCCLTAREGDRRRSFINAGRYIDDFEKRAGTCAVTRRRGAHASARGADASPPR